VKGKAVLTAETERGRRAIAQVMQRSYVADIDAVPAAWTRVLVVDDEPVSFIIVDPDRRMEYSGEDLRYAFICDVATREDRRGEGHFRYIMAHTFSSLRAAGIPLVVTHGRYQLYRRFGFDVFTHHCGIFTTPDRIEAWLGTQVPERANHLVVIDEAGYTLEDLLLVTDVKATTFVESRVALRAAAAEARERQKSRILFEHPPAPSYGSRYPTYPSIETPFSALARTCGAQICVQGADPERGSVPDADWIKVLDVAVFLRAALSGVVDSSGSLPNGVVGFDTDAGAATVESDDRGVQLTEGLSPEAVRVAWPSSALAQLVTGYRSADVLSAIHNTAFPTGIRNLLEVLFPQRWRFSRNESWTYRS
jgi:predicted N-acetyltransferase YhbS